MSESDTHLFTVQEAEQIRDRELRAYAILEYYTGWLAAWIAEGEKIQ